MQPSACSCTQYIDLIQMHYSHVQYRNLHVHDVCTLIHTRKQSSHHLPIRWPFICHYCQRVPDSPTATLVWLQMLRTSIDTTRNGPELWRVQKARQRKSHALHMNGPADSLLKAHRNTCTHVAFTPNGHCLSMMLMAQRIKQAPQRLSTRPAVCHISNHQQQRYVRQHPSAGCALKVSCKGRSQ